MSPPRNPSASWRCFPLGHPPPRPGRSPNLNAAPLQLKTRQFNVVVERDAEGFFVATVPSLPGCHTQARSLDQLMERVTQPHLPPLEELMPLLQQIWDRRIHTNNGPFHKELEQALCEYLGVEHLSLFANGTLALVTALRALRITGEVITTPYSFVATAHSLLWNNITLVDLRLIGCRADICPQG